MSKLKDYDDSLRTTHSDLVAGFDEAGRGPLCGPVVAAGVILPSDYDNPFIDDSKKLTDHKRRLMFEEIKAHALYYYISVIPAAKIDEINILEASRLGMQMALDSMEENGYSPSVVVTDYMKLKTAKPLYALKKGDATSLAVAAASILAKVTRDDIMIELDAKYPEYQFKKHKGYGTKLHMEMIEKYGIIDEIYRKTFAPIRKVTQKT